MGQTVDFQFNKKNKPQQYRQPAYREHCIASTLPNTSAVHQVGAVPYFLCSTRWVHWQITQLMCDHWGTRSYTATVSGAASQIAGWHC